MLGQLALGLRGFRLKIKKVILADFIKNKKVKKITLRVFLVVL